MGCIWYNVLKFVYKFKKDILYDMIGSYEYFGILWGEVLYVDL